MIRARQSRISNQRLSSFLGLLAVTAVGVLAGFFVFSAGTPLKLGIGLMGLIAAALIMKRIEYGLMLLVFLTYTNFFAFAALHTQLPIVELLILLLLAAVLFNALFRGNYPTGWLRPFSWLVAYGVIGLLSLAYASHLSSTTDALLQFLKSATLATMVIVLLQNGKFLRHVVWALICAGLLMSTVSVYQYLTGNWSNDFGGFARAELNYLAAGQFGYRIAGPIGDSNFFAQVLIVLIPLSFERLWREKNILLRVVAAMALLIITLAVVLTFSRGAFLALCVTVAFTVLWVRPRFKHLILAIVLAMPLLTIVPKTYFQRLQTMVELLPGMGGRGVDADQSFRGRASEWRSALMMFKEHPLLGVGLGNYPIHYQQYSRRIGLDPRLSNRSAHSLYLQIAAETGLIGLLAFGILLYKALVGLWRSRKQFLEAEKFDSASLCSVYTVALLGYLTAGIFLHSAYPNFLWILIGIALAMPLAARNELYKKQAESDLANQVSYQTPGNIS